jgi:hypothetical protein
MKANQIQIGGSHYKQKDGGEEHWDRVARLGLDYFQARITAYVERCWKKNGIQDLKKALHFLEKYIELHESGRVEWMEDSQTPLVSWRLTALPTFEPGRHVDGARVYPTGWIGYVFEGADADGFLYTCKKCNAKIIAEENRDPHEVHEPFCGNPFATDANNTVSAFAEAARRILGDTRKADEAEAFAKLGVEPPTTFGVDPASGPDMSSEPGPTYIDPDKPS